MEPVLHFAIPFAVAALLGFRLRWALAIGIVATLPDLDIFFYTHRSIDHSLLPSIALLLALAALRLNSKPRIARKLKYPVLALAAGWASHVLLDLTSSFTPLFWPVAPVAYRLVFQSSIHIGSVPSPSITLALLQQPYAPTTFTTFDAEIFTAEGLLLSLLLIALSFAVRYQGFLPLKPSLVALSRRFRRSPPPPSGPAPDAPV